MPNRTSWRHNQAINTQFRLNSQSPLANGLLGWWPLIGSRGMVAARDYSGFGNHFTTLNGTTTWSPNAAFGWGLQFDAAGEYATTATSTGWPVGASRTWSLWIQQLSTAGTRRLIQELSGNLFVIRGSGSDLNVFFFDGSGIQAHTATGRLGAVGLYHIVVIWNLATAATTTYVNGIKDSTTFVGSPGPDSATGAVSMSVTDEFANSVILDAARWGRALSDAEAIRLYKNRFELYEPLIRQWVVGKAPTSGNVTINAAAGTLTLAGQQATVQPGAVTVSAAAGTLALAGQTAILQAVTTIAAAAGTLTLAGQSASVVPGAISVAANAGTLALSGQTASIVPGAISVAASAGALALAGQSATLVAGTIISASQGTLALAGQTASIVPGAVSIAAAAGSLTLAGQQAVAQAGNPTVAANAGTLALSGLDATILGGKLPVGRGIVWIGTFESQNEDELESDIDNNPAENSGTNTLSYTTTHAHSGTYAAQLLINTGAAAAGIRLFRKKEIWENLEPYYYSAWYYFPSLPTVGTFFNIFQFKYNLGGVSEVAWKLEANNFDVGAGPQLGLRLVWDAPMNGPFEGDGNTNAGQSFYQGTLGVDSIPIPIAQWVHIECYLEQSEAYDGRIMAWQNGVQVFDVRDIRTKDVGSNNNWSVNNYGGGITPNPWTIHIDDMVVSTERSYPVWFMPTDTKQPDATAGIDTLIRSSSATTNFGTSTTIRVGEVAGSAITDRGLFKPDLSGIPAGATIHSCMLSLMVTGKSDASNNRYIAVYRQKRAWVEAQATWNIYSTGNNWGAAGGFDTTDCEQTAAGQIWLFQAMQVNRRVNIMLDCRLVQEWIDGTFANNGVLLKSISELNDAFIFASSDNVTATNRPYWQIIYSVDVTVSASPGSLGLAGQSATVVLDVATVQAAVGALALGGQTATVVAGPVAVAASAGVLALAGQSASILIGVVINAAAGALAIAGQAASIVPGAVSVGAQAGVLALSGQAATISTIVSGITINAAAGTLSLAGQTSAIQPGAVIVVAAIASLTIIGRQASINQGITRGDWDISDRAKYLWDTSDVAKYQWEVIDAARYIWILTDSSR